MDSGWQMTRGCGGGYSSIGKAQSRAPSQIAQHFARGVISRDPRHAAARVDRAAAQIESLEGGPIVREVRHRALKEQLIERELTLEDVALRETYDLFDIRSQQELVGNDFARKPGS